jgi:trehalose 6-phosphate synthase
MRKLRRGLRDHDIYRWLDTFLDAAISRELADFPLVQDYLPVAAGQ